ncbi:MAG: BlaI/MecI/CopY family transcriptional regulator [Acidobacteria bacterium]|nr:BlaI/MecI/CopY family transcriptional regulator [Acidobacteriota bacterium]
MSGRSLRFWGFRPPREVADGALGTLERRVLDVTTAMGEASVRDVAAHLDPSAAYTTVMTTLDRLYRKGMLDRVKHGRAFVYRAVHTTSDIQRTMATALVDGVLGRGDAHAVPLLSSLVDAVTEHDARYLDTLEQLVRDKREALAKKDGD